MKVALLNDLCDDGYLRSYTYDAVDENGDTLENPGRGMNESEVLNLVFPDGRQLTISMVCSGSLENLSFLFNEET